MIINNNLENQNNINNDVYFGMQVYIYGFTDTDYDYEGLYQA